MNTPSPSPQSEPNDALLERYVLGELDAERAEQLRLLAASDAGLRARINALGASDAAILERYPVEAMARAIRNRPATGAERNASGTRSGRTGTRSRSSLIDAVFAPSRLRLATPVFALLICGVFLLARHGQNGAAEKPTGNQEGAGNTQVSQAEPAGDVRLKGAESGLAIFRKTRTGSELLPPRSAARPGDTLQVFYHSRLAVYGIVFSVDGAGAITLHYPEAEGPAPALQIGDMLPLPHAFRLDKAPRFERFYLVTAPRPFSSEGLLARMRGHFSPLSHPGQTGHSNPPGHLPADAAPADTLPGLDADFRQYPYTIFKAGSGPRKSRKEPGR
jgi:hypothetical protein